MSQTSKRRILLAGLPGLAGLVLVSRVFEAQIINLLKLLIHKTPSTAWPRDLVALGWGLILLGLAIALGPAAWQALKRLDTALARKVDKICGPAGESSGPEQSWPRFNRTDWILTGLFLLISLLIFVGSIQDNYPYIQLGGDASNIASYAAGFDHPELFRGDLLLEDPQNYRLYMTFGVLFMRLVNPWVGSYSLTFLLLLPIQNFLQLLGFYLLGRVLFHRRYWAFLLTGLLSLNFVLNLGEYWGLYPETISRYNFQALLSFVLCMALIWRNQPRRWPWIMAAVGALVYFHPVSTPAWLVAIWLGLWFLAPPNWPFKKKLGIMAGLGGIAVLVMAPFIWMYFTNHVQGASPDYQLVMDTITNTFPPQILDVPGAVITFASILTRAGVLPLGLASLAVLWILLYKRRQALLVVLIWTGSIILVSILVPWVERYVEHIINRIPFETELIRGIRYLVPLLLLFFIWMSYELHQRLPKTAARRAVAGLAGLVVIAGLLLFPPNPEVIQKAVVCLSQGKLVCGQASDYDQVLNAIREDVPLGAPVYVTFANQGLKTFGIPVRYLTMHPLVYAYKDRGQLVYSNPEALKRWDSIYQKVRVIDRKAGEPDRMMELHLGLARELNARYLLADFKTDLTKPEFRKLKRIYDNPQYSLFEILQ